MEPGGGGGSGTGRKARNKSRSPLMDKLPAGAPLLPPPPPHNYWSNNNTNGTDMQLSGATKPVSWRVCGMLLLISLCALLVGGDMMVMEARIRYYGYFPMDGTLSTLPPTLPVEEKIVQKLPTGKKKVSRKDEADFACLELDCNKQCLAKISCLTTHCTNEKTKKCQKDCAKARCKARCKLDPKVSYVEREQKLEKCLDSCAEGNSKCRERCEEEAKTCAHRCKDRAARFFCVRPLSILNAKDDLEETANNAGASSSTTAAAASFDSRDEEEDDAIDAVFDDSAPI